MKPERVDECMLQYKEYSARCEFLQHEIHELENLAEQLRTNQVNDMISLSQVITGMPHGTSISDPTGKLGILLAEGYENDFIKQVEAEIVQKQKEYRMKISTVVFVDAWVKVLTIRERYVIENKKIGSMYWRELIAGFKKEFGEVYSRQGLKKIMDNAMKKIYNVAK